MIESGNVSYTRSIEGLTTGIFLNMQQADYRDKTSFVHLGDIDAMYSYALSGLSAKRYMQPDCGVRIEVGDKVRIPIKFYVFTSHEDLAYDLSSASGEITDHGEVLISKSWSVVADITDTIPLPFRMVDLATNWETPTYYENGKKTSGTTERTLDSDGLNILLDKEVFGVLRVRGRAIAQLHCLTIEIEKVEGHYVADIKANVTAKWEEDGKAQSKILQLEVPPCAYDNLSDCPDGEITGVDTLTVDRREPRPVVFYSTCTGRVLGVRYVQYSV